MRKGLKLMLFAILLFCYSIISQVPSIPYSPPASNLYEGTGFFINETGTILTCAHMVENYKTVTVYYNHKEYAAKVLWVDKYKDLAVLEIPNPDNIKFNFLSFDLKHPIHKGQPSYILGFPHSIETDDSSFTAGVISRFIDMGVEHWAIQVDSSINPGNSGGPALSKWGGIQGVVYMKTVSIDMEGIGFIIPNTTAVDFLKINNVAYSEVTDDVIYTPEQIATRDSSVVYILEETNDRVFN